MKGKNAALTAYGVLLVCLAFALGYLLGQGGEQTQVQVTVTPAVVTETAASVEVPVQLPSETGLVNINTASQLELEQLPGIGPELAGRIIAYRREHGDFVSKEQIMDVKGIGEKRYADLEGIITIGGMQ